MKKGILFSSIGGLAVLMLALVFSVPSESKEYYTPRDTNSSANFGYKGSAEKLHQMRANQITGEIDPAAVMAARAQNEAFLKNQKKSSLGLQWSEVGPDNIGGRTRCFLISNKDPKVFFMGSVSGGLFKSVNSGSSWYPVNDQESNLAVVSLAQSADGEIVYYGTGEGMYYAQSGDKGRGIAGGGLFKSTDGGLTFSVVPSTIPSSSGTDFSSIGKVEVSPTNPNQVYISTNRGFLISTDGGANWTNPLGTLISTDMCITKSGVVWVKVGSSIYKSDATGNNFNEISKISPGVNDLPRSGPRARIAVSPQDENYVYVAASTQSGDFNKAYQSKDGGATWTVIGEANSFLNPFGGQANAFDLALEVSSQDKNRIFIGGTHFWEWSSTNGWFQIADYFPNGVNVALGNWVHPDLHKLAFHPTLKNNIYLTTDGGVFRSTDNGTSWFNINRNYGTIQFYDIAVGSDGIAVGGAQDNSNIIVKQNDPLFPKRGERISTGDGGQVEISQLDPNLIFAETQYGNAFRMYDQGAVRRSLLDLDRMAPNPAHQPGDGFNFADFTAPFAMYENVFDTKSIDTVHFEADSVNLSVGLGGGKTFFEGTFSRPQTTTKFHLDGVTIKAGPQRATTDASGNFVGDAVAGTFDATTGKFNVTFANPVFGFEVNAKVAVYYDAGDTVQIVSLTNDIPLPRVIPSTGLASNQSVAYQDPVQSSFFMGLTGHSASGSNSYGGIWMTRNAISDPTATPTWYHIGNVFNGETPTAMHVSNDGDMLYVGTSSGRLYRFSNLSNARDSASTDIDDFYTNGTITRPNTSVVVKTTVSGIPSGRSITSVRIDPNNKNNVIVTLGNYNNSSYVYYSSNGAGASPVFTAKQGNLPTFPVYTSIFNAMGPAGQVLVGTENGVFTTDDITTNPVVWTKEINGFSNVPVFDLVQYLTVRRDLQLFGNVEGAIYAGTHGRGIFRTNTTQSIGIEETPIVNDWKESKVLNLYPNPSKSEVFISLDLESRTDVLLTIRDINGKLVRNVKYKQLAKETEELEINISTLPTGTYIVTVHKGAESISGKLIKP